MLESILRLIKKNQSRTITLGNTPVKVKSLENFTSWACKANSYDDDILLEIGYYDIKGMAQDGSDFRMGFILLEGENSAETGYYVRKGLERHWEWDSDHKNEGFNYSLRMKSDGSAMYFDFSEVEVGGSTSPSQFFQCTKDK